MRVVLLVLVTALVSFTLGWCASNALAARGAASRKDAELEPPSKTNDAEQQRPIAHEIERDPETVKSNPEVQARTEEGLISSALRRYALAEIDGGWRESRKGALPAELLARGFDEFEATVKSLPREIGRSLAKTRSQKERLAGDDPFAVLDALTEGDLGPQIDIVRDTERFERFFACADGLRIDGPTLLAEEEQTPIPPGSVIAFPAGVYEIDKLARRMLSKIRCVSIVGAGMDRTLLRFRTLRMIDRLERFEVRDCTLDSEAVAIAIHVPGVWRAERVRFIGFDCGAGSSSTFSAMGGAILELKSCRIEGGFGRNPEFGILFDVRSNAFIAHFEGCVIDTVFLRQGLWPKSGTLVFDRCRITNVLDAETLVDRDDDGLVLYATTIELRPRDAGHITPRNLSELFPAWIPPLPR